MVDFRMDQDFGPSALDRGVQGVLGKPIDRIDGVAKVTGAALYAAEHKPDGKMAYGYAITATIAAGTVRAIDTSAAAALPGVIAIITDDPRLPSESPIIRQPRMPRADGTLESYGQILGVAVADSFEAARAAALAVRVDYLPVKGRYDTRAGAATAQDPPEGAMLPNLAKGDVDAAMAAAEVAIDQHYATPYQVHAAMEPHAAVASWHGDELTLYGAIQIMRAFVPVLAASLEMPAEKIHVLSPYIGGGFGGKIGGAETVLAAIAAQHVGRPVKVQLTRQQLFHSVYGRSDTHQRVQLAATRDGVLTALAQDSLVSQKTGYGFFEPVALGALSLYAAPNRRFTTRIAKLNVTPAGAVRAPGEAVGMMALETALDELAERLGMDPVALRKANEPATDPMTGKPFSTRRLIDCYDEGARRFGWERRVPTPGTVREGDWLIGMGMATAARVNFLADSMARVRLTPAGLAEIETDMTDIGTGTYTILAQVAAEALGLPVERVRVRLGDSRDPAGAGSGGSFGAASSASSVMLACEDLVAELARRMGAAPAEMTLKDGHAIAGNRRVPIGELVGDAPVEAMGVLRPGSNSRSWSQGTFGAQFAEVAVHAVSGEVRVRRLLGVFDCGRVLNAKTARSQAIGGMIWGLGYALHEAAILDPRTGAYVNRDLGEYHIPVNADVPQIEAYFIEEIDPHASPVGAKGLGELGISGVGAAVTNAVYNACGARAREWPMTLDHILPHLPAV
ncbi:xanthine dehydrogenase family protein molybdopterin-binding subunit [Sphingomonas sp.]|uniref:xanthine dehydrogenase family protein molybdopterin-binding subunit n=1 Tax=Sphingomonas sp. TaxID=28214 RepID=UPI001DC069A2|nr:xanthine dehydrogenase family protein molybdopterin-binding subunit [Sphingomonas sp.]MBX9797542.1 xanthine dehydrogenase family protein molybdopterin-binding subunit [Sphingomonas sp.]